jgi:pimeloyl-ACP methyl ester carboxylesterase
MGKPLDVSLVCFARRVWSNFPETLDHTPEYLARSIPNAEFVYLPGVSHFAPLQRPELFNSAILAFLGRIHI